MLKTLKFKDGKLVEVQAKDAVHALDSLAELHGMKEGAAAQVQVGWTLADIRELLERRDRNLRDLKDFTPRVLPPPDGGPASPSGAEPTSRPRRKVTFDELLEARERLPP